eukprot:m.729713 g.729713  ORF g.729713 m.729713 type:complete len:64 (+) comp23050_c0_seq30:2745-2936(+)
MPHRGTDRALGKLVILLVDTSTISPIVLCGLVPYVPPPEKAEGVNDRPQPMCVAEEVTGLISI